MRLTFNRLVVAVTFLSLFAMAARISADSDTWWQLRAGAWIVEQGQIPRQDPFTSTFAGQPWTYPAWLSELVLYAAYQAGGLPGLNLLTALCVTLAFAFVFATCPGGVFVRAGAVLLGAMASAVFWSARAHILSFVLAAALLYLLDEFRRRGRNRLWLLPPLMALWGNIHPGYSYGLGFLAVTAAGECVRALLGQAPWRRVAWLAAIGGLSALALLVSPFGIGQWTYPFSVVAKGAVQNLIQEWQSPNFHLREAQVFIWLWLATFAVVGLSRKPINLTDLLLLSAGLVLGLLAGRNIALFALVAPPVLARHAQALVDERRAQFPRLAALLDGYAGPERPGASWLNAVVLALVALAAGLKLALPLSPRLNQQLALREMPAAAADYLAQARPAGPLFNPYAWGGYLAWRLYPDYPVYVDGRTDIYDDAFLLEYLRLEAGAPEWEAVLARHGVRLLLVQAGSPLATLAAQDASWAQVYADPVAVVFERQP